MTNLAPRHDMEYICAGKNTLAFVFVHIWIVLEDCGVKNEIKPREPIRCRECGHRIMYKKRTTRSMYTYHFINEWQLRNVDSGAIRSTMSIYTGDLQVASRNRFRLFVCMSKRSNVAVPAS